MEGVSLLAYERLAAEMVAMPRLNAPVLHVLVDGRRLRLSLDNRLVLLLDHHGHVVEELGELRQRLLDPLDVLVPGLDLAVGRVGLAVPVRGQQLEFRGSGGRES